MSQARPFAYNTGSTITDMQQSGDLAIGPLTGSTHRYDLGYGEVKWYMGADEEIGYIIGRPLDQTKKPTFLRSEFTEQAYLQLVNYIYLRYGGGVTPFTNTLAAKNWINAEGYWQTYTGGTVPLEELFTFETNGTTLNNLQVGGSSLDSGDNPEWDFDDTTTDDTVNSNFTHTYIGGYVSPAEKTVVFSLSTPADATTLNLYGTNPASKNDIHSVELSGFTSLEVLNIGSTDLTEIDLSANTNLITLTLPSTDITSLDVSNNTNLTSLNASLSASLTSLDVSNCSSLATLQAYSTGLGSFDLSDLTALSTLFIQTNSISELDLTNNGSLSNLWAYSSNLTTLNLTGNTSISQIDVNDSEIESVLFDTGSTYSSFQSINLKDNSMTANEINAFMSHIWDMRTKLTSGFKSMKLSGNNADFSFLSTHRLLALQKDHSFNSFGSEYNIPDDIMEFGWTSASSSSSITSYFQWNLSNSPSKRTIYSNDISGTSGYTDLSCKVYVDTTLDDFQSSNVQWDIRLRYKKHNTDSYTDLDDTTYTLTGNTSGMELVNDISPVTISGINGTDFFQWTVELILTDNRADKTQVGGDAMTLRVVPTISSPNQNAGIVTYPYDTITQDLVRTKWGD